VNGRTLPLARQVEWPDKYDLSLVFAGAGFDALTAIYHRTLVEDGVIPESALRKRPHGPGESRADLRKAFGPRYDRTPAAFHEALRTARDWLCRVLAVAWTASASETLTFSTVLRRMLEADAALAKAFGRPSRGELIRREFDARGIVPA
jgi:hypothetical protein